MALSLLGHDPDLTDFSAYLLNKARPRLVLDIGANYGQFSIRWLLHDVRTISFEPNPNCHPYFQMFCLKNRVRCEIEPVALGSSEGTATLFFSPREEWLGTICDHTRVFARHIEVRQRTLDGYVEEHHLKPDVLKIDAEGSDLAILQGALVTLARHRPLILFESLDHGERSKFYDVLKSTAYAASACCLWQMGCLAYSI